MKPEHMSWEQYAGWLENKLRESRPYDIPKAECNRRICDTRGCQFPPDCIDKEFQKYLKKNKK